MSLQIGNQSEDSTALALRQATSMTVILKRQRNENADLVAVRQLEVMTLTTRLEALQAAYDTCKADLDRERSQHLLLREAHSATIQKLKSASAELELRSKPTRRRKSAQP